MVFSPTSSILIPSVVPTRERERERERMSKEMSQQRKDYVDPPLAPLIDLAKIKLQSFYKALIVEFVVTLLFLYGTIAIVIGHKKKTGPCDGIGLLGIAQAFDGMIFVLVYCTANISGSPLLRQQLEAPQRHCYLHLRHPHGLHTCVTSSRRRNIHFTALDLDPRSCNYLRCESVSDDIAHDFRVEERENEGMCMRGDNLKFLPIK